jgi:uncharacterized caspase-like protein
MSSPVLLRRLLVAALVGLAALRPLRAQEPEPKRYAVLVGINRYQHPKLPELQFAEADVTDLANVLRDAGYEVTLLTGSGGDEALRPTKANVESQVQDVLRRCAAGDTVLLAFTGHGVQFDGKKDCFFCPADGRPFRDETNTLVSLSKVYAELNKSFAGMKVLLVDACRDDPDAGRGARGINADGAPRPPQGVAALFSCRAGERAYESERLGHGVFFYHVLEALKGAAKDGENEVTFAGLAAYVSRRVSRGDTSVPQLIGAGARQSPNLKADYSTEPVLVKVAAQGGEPQQATDPNPPGTEQTTDPEPPGTDQPTDPEPPATEEPVKEQYAAIAYSQSTNKYGYAGGYDTREAAEEGARESCKADDAKVVVWARDGWCVLALDVDGGGAYGWSWSANLEDAKATALTNCQKHVTNCYVAVCVSGSGDVKQFDPPQ